MNEPNILINHAAQIKIFILKIEWSHASAEIAVDKVNVALYRNVVFGKIEKVVQTKAYILKCFDLSDSIVEGANRLEKLIAWHHLAKDGRAHLVVARAIHTT